MLLSEKRFKEQPKKSTSFTNSVFFGLFFGAGWSPCIGLVLSSILLLAADSDTMLKGMFMLFIYSMGLGIPFIIVALLWSRSLHKLRKINRLLPKIQKGSGIIMIALGVLLFTGQFAAIAAYLTRFQFFNL